MYDRPTMDLRFVQRVEAVEKYSEHHGGIVAYAERPIRVLQQRWITSDGEEWRDVPFETERDS